jgi:hypothetical protein
MHHNEWTAEIQPGRRETVDKGVREEHRRAVFSDEELQEPRAAVEICFLDIFDYTLLSYC